MNKKSVTTSQTHFSLTNIKSKPEFQPYRNKLLFHHQKKENHLIPFRKRRGIMDVLYVNFVRIAMDFLPDKVVVTIAKALLAVDQNFT
jgi:hypothetical protein